MVKLACDLLDLKQGERVLDLFCGLGNFSLPLARCVGATGQVVGVEGSEEMVQRGAENAERNAWPVEVLFTRFNKRFLASFLGKSRI
jgi:23S rRNA (uracil1939-C5)-methyltransferase